MALQRYYRAIENAASRPGARVYSGAVFSFLAISLFGLYAILPTAKTVLFLRREIKDKAAVNLQMEEKITSLIEVQAAYENAGNAVNLVNEAIPTIPEAVELARELRNLAALSQAALSSLQISAVSLLGDEATTSATLVTGQKDFSVALTLVGRFPQIQAFLDGILAMRRIVTIEAIRISPSTGGVGAAEGEGTLLQAVITLKAFYE